MYTFVMSVFKIIFDFQCSKIVKKELARLIGFLFFFSSNGFYDLQMKLEYSGTLIGTIKNKWLVYQKILFFIYELFIIIQFYAISFAEL